MPSFRDADLAAIKARYESNYALIAKDPKIANDPVIIAALARDDDALAITSLNWLSADPPDLAVYREIGVLIEAPKIAENFIRVFENARIFASLTMLASIDPARPLHCLTR